MKQTRQLDFVVGSNLAARFHATRALTEALAAPLSDADATIQSMEDASPAKWHLAHTTWFWETFLLRDHVPGYRPFDERWAFLHNSYYEAEGARVSRTARGMLSRPTLAEVLAYRAHVTAAMEPLLQREECAALVALGIAHEQQHGELLLTDIKHALFLNPLGAAMWPHQSTGAGEDLKPSGGLDEEGSRLPGDSGHGEWHRHPGGVAWIGHGGAGFAFDNEGPSHRVLLEPFALAERLVTNREWLAFMNDDAYGTASLWLADGLAWVQREGIGAPLYWRRAGDDWEQFTHTGWQPVELDAPVTHISYYEADAYAHWAGKRLPTEFEWEAIAQAYDPASGNQCDRAAPPLPCGEAGLFGDCWQWTRSAYLPYPRFRAAAGAVGEYNGKFMSGQFVLKGASCATVRGHSRPSYRNFFYPHQRWQFTGLRLAADL